MQKNLDRMGGLVHSQRVLLALTQAGLSREESYALVQRNAMKVWESDGELSLLDLLKADPEVVAAPVGRPARALFDLGYHLKHVDTIFVRVFGSVGLTVSHSARFLSAAAQFAAILVAQIGAGGRWKRTTN